MLQTPPSHACQIMLIITYLTLILVPFAAAIYLTFVLLLGVSIKLIAISVFIIILITMIGAMLYE